MGMILSALPLNVFLTSASLVFVYGLPYGTLMYQKGAFKETYLNALLFMLAFMLVTFNLSFISLALGALTTVLILKIKEARCYF